MAASGLVNKINFYSPQFRFRLKERKLLKKFIARILKTEKKQLLELNFIFCTDEFLLKMNQQYLNHNTYTDIISFDLSSGTGSIHGEIYISLYRVKENALIFNSSFSKELLRVIFHGVLHLCGYKDKSRPEKEEMTSKENHYLERYQAYVSREKRST